MEASSIYFHNMLIHLIKQINIFLLDIILQIFLVDYYHGFLFLLWYVHLVSALSSIIIIKF